MSTLGKVVRSGVGRRRVQTVIIVLASLMAVTSAVLAGSLLVASSAPFERSFTEQHGAHLSVLYSTTPPAAVSGASESSGPFRVAIRNPTLAPGPGHPSEIQLPPLTIAGRSQPTDGIDRVSLLEGRWATAAGEIVVTDGPPVGTSLLFDGVSYTVVGRARSVSRTADAWVAPSVVESLKPTGYQMLYRLSTPSDVSATVSSLDSSSVLGSRSWLTLKQEAERTAALFVPFLVAFGLLGLAMAVLSVGGVVAGAVGSATYRIGILKAIGFTPAQIVRAYLAQALIPAGIGIALGVVAGNLLTIPVMQIASEVYESTPSGVVPWVDVLVVAAAVAVVGFTAWVASYRAGRLRTVDALAVGRTPSAGRGRWAASLTARLPLPRPLGLGLGQPFARPARMIAMIATVVFGTAAVALAVGLATSLARVEVARTHDTAPIVVAAFGPAGSGSAPPSASVSGSPGSSGSGSGSPGSGSGGAVAGGPGGAGPLRVGPGDDSSLPTAAAVTAAIASVPGTSAYYGIADIPVTIAGVAGSVDLIGYTDNPSWAGFELTDGRWYQSTGEALAPTPLLTALGAKVGDTVTVTVDGHLTAVRIVGEVFSTKNDGMQLFTSYDTVTAIRPITKPGEYRVAVASGVSVDKYTTALNKAVSALGLQAQPNTVGQSDTLVALNALTGVLTLMLVAVAALGVLNAVVLQTRERVRELGVHKALGMTPRQSIAVVLASVVLIGLVGGALGVPAGMALHGVMVPAMGSSAGLRLPAMIMDVYRPAILALLALGGLVIAVVGALLPATWAARLPTATALRTE